MTQNFTNKNFMSNLMNLAALFVIVFGAVSCTDEEFITDEPENPAAPGDTTAVMSDFQLHHGAWKVSDGLAKADHYFSGIIDLKVNGEVVDGVFIERENAPMEISWEPIAETTSASAVKEYLGKTSGVAKKAEAHSNQKVNFIKYERECKLSFVGMEVTLTGSWYEASLLGAVAGCRYDSTTVAKQDAILLETIEQNGEKYNRFQVTAHAVNHFTDMPSQKAHQEEMNIQYSVLVPENVEPGEKIYEGSIAGNGSYTKASEESYESKLDLTHIFTQDGQQIKEQETVSGLATVKTWVEGDNVAKIWSSSNIGNPSVSVNETVSELYQKSEYIYAKMYKTVWTYTWSDSQTGESFRKEVHSEVERLYYRREAGKEVAMPYGETTTSYAGFNAGAAVIKTQNGKEYESYSEQISFNGNHKSTTGNVNDAISGLKAGQEIWVEVEAESPTTPDPWGEIDIEKTKKFGTISVAWEAQAGNEKLLPIYTGTIITSKGIISFMKGYKQFTAMNTNTITDQVGNAWNGTKLFPSYIEVDRSGKNISWAYLSVIDGELFDDVNSSKMTLEGGLNKETPFVATGGDANVYTFSENGNVVRVVVTYQGVVMFDEVFAK